MTKPTEQPQKRTPRPMNKERRATSHILGILSEFGPDAQVRMLDHIRGIIAADLPNSNSLPPA